MRHPRRVWKATCAAAALIGGIATGGPLAPAHASMVAAAPTVAPYAGPSGMVHALLEFPTGTDLDHYDDWVLEKVGVPDDEHEARKPWGSLMWEIDMIGLYLTPEEAADAYALTGSGPLLSVESTGTVSLPTPTDRDGFLTQPADGGGPFAAPGQMGWEEVPVGFRRIGVPVDEWRSAPSSSGIRVAIIDTGIDGRHEDLESQVVDGFNCSQDERGPDGYDIDAHGHGTWIAGLIGAKHNEIFTVGIAPGVAMTSEVVFGASGSASGMMVACGINQALAHGADVISASLGGGSIPTRCGGPSVYVNAWCKAAQRAIVVVAAGNDTADAIGKAPANVPGVVTVGAIVDFDGEAGEQVRGFVGCGQFHRDDYLAVFSNFGSEVEVVAPGACEVSLAPLQSEGVMSGTSMATPYVSGVFAAFLAKFPDCRGREAIRTVLNYAERYARDHPDEGYSGWPGAFPPPIIRYVDEEPLRIQPDPENPKYCAFEEES